ncbi:Saposin [Hexamita inflata]|uniref:Putative n=1 Tax=Hexamita inflata TaxID=28002 RepID=A0AA86VTE9_9EUKA|nr:Saposin [Hexamita inflata]
MIFMLFNVLAKDSLGCQVCQQTMGFVYDLLENGATKEAIEEGLQQICTIFPEGEWKQDCEKFIVTEYEKIIVILEGDFPVATLCTLMGACDYPLPPISSGCDMCMAGMIFLEDLMSVDLGLELIEFVLDYVCEIFPDTWYADCKTFINSEYEKLVPFLDNEFPPEYICTVTGACKFPFEPKEDPTCEFCIGAFDFLYDLFDFTTENGSNVIEMALDYVCYLFPEGKNRDVCTNFVDQEYDNLVHYIENEFTPKAICSLIDACDYEDPTYETECEFCRIFYQMALDLISFDATEEMIEEFLDHICDIFDSQIAVKTCRIFIDKNFEKLVDSLLQKYPTELACEMFGACTM